MVTRIVKRKFLIQALIETLLKHNPDYYKSILQAAERGELWGVNTHQNHFIQLKFDFNPSKFI